MIWKLLDDPDNVENANAGNGGDLVKHTLYQATLEYLLAHEPWKQELHVRECHAGRGIYQIPTGDKRLNMLRCLFAHSTINVALQNVQRDILCSVGCQTEADKALQWYAGSALINAYILSRSELGRRLLELYEWRPDTRHILRSIFNETNLASNISINILPVEKENGEFDGEAYIEQELPGWQKHDVILLDPFAMWRQARDQRKRDRYGSIVETLLRRQSNASCLVLFWTWGRAFLVADSDLAGTNDPVRNGYQELRAKLHAADRHVILVKWRWALQFAMWILVPEEHLAALRNKIQDDCRLLSEHLRRNGCHLQHPEVQVTID